MSIIEGEPCGHCGQAEAVMDDLCVACFNAGLARGGVVMAPGTETLGLSEREAFRRGLKKCDDAQFQELIDALYEIRKIVTYSNQDYDRGSQLLRVTNAICAVGQTPNKRVTS